MQNIIVWTDRIYKLNIRTKMKNTSNFVVLRFMLIETDKILFKFGDQDQNRNIKLSGFSLEQI